MQDEQNQGQLARGLKNRHIQMIALGGCIGTGLFYGSGKAIQLAGPSVLLAYMIGGLFIYMVMRMLGEMSTEEPVAGAFSHFAYKYWGELPGFITGWNYWLLYILVSMAEISAVGAYIHFWDNTIPPWKTALVVWAVVALINLLNVRLFGEFEFWFSLIKVLAVIGMIVLGVVLIVMGFSSGMGGVESTVSIANLWQYDGFFPFSVYGLLLSLAVVMFSFGGTELIGITAAEADDPKKSIPRAIKQVVWRILLFYILSLTVILILYPWSKIDGKISPFVMIFSELGIPYAASILNIVVITAAVSVYNSGMYSNGRMLHGLASQGNAPKIFKKLGRNYVPYVGVLFSSLCTFMAVVINFLVPEDAFMQVMALALAAAAITWGMIILVQLRFRKQNDASKLTFKAPFYPYVNYICLAFLILMLIMMLQIPSMRVATFALPIWLAVLCIGFKLKKRFKQ